MARPVPASPRLAALPLPEASDFLQSSAQAPFPRGIFMV